MAGRRSKKTRPSGSPETLARKREERGIRAVHRRRKRYALAGAVTLFLFAAVGALGFAGTRSERRARDLARIGNGIPAVVQVHDTTCPFCSELRANIREIEEHFSDDVLLIRVADVHTEEGLTFARQYTTQRRVTLLFLDGAGELVDVQVGVQEPDALQRSFNRHARGEL